MRVPFHCLLLLMLLVATGGQAQTAASIKIKREIYSAWLTTAIEQSESLEHRKTASVVVVPSVRLSVQMIDGDFDFLSILKMRCESARARQRQSPPSRRTKPMLSGSSRTGVDSMLVQIARREDQFYQWLSADSGRTHMTRQLASVVRVPNALPASLDVPRKRVVIADSSFYDSPKWRDWNSFHRRNKNSFGVVEFSEVSFSPDYRAAAFYVGVSQGLMSGVGCLVFM